MGVREKKWGRQSAPSLPAHPSLASALGSLLSVALSSGPARTTLSQRDAIREAKTTTCHRIQNNNVSPYNNNLSSGALYHSIITIYIGKIPSQETRSKKKETGRERESNQTKWFLVHSMEIG